MLSRLTVRDDQHLNKNCKKFRQLFHSRPARVSLPHFLAFIGKALAQRTPRDLIGMVIGYRAAKR
jgi:hypothetical protein